MSKVYKNNVIIEEGIVYKKTNTSLKELYSFLDSVSFNNYPKLLGENAQEYIESTKYHEITKGYELIKTISQLHYKTIFFKDISKNKYKKIYDKLNNNISYLKKYYEEMINNIENEVFMSPSNYLIARNYTIIDSSLNYSEKELKSWYNLITKKNKERVCTLHNNLKMDHFIKGDKNYLISWDNYLVDTPILDLYIFYKTEGYKLDFSLLFNTYNENLKLLEEEIKLFNILISMPPKIIKIKDEYENIINIKDTFKYMYSSMKFVNENKST